MYRDSRQIWTVNKSVYYFQHSKLNLRLIIFRQYFGLCVSLNSLDYSLEDTTAKRRHELISARKLTAVWTVKKKRNYFNAKKKLRQIFHTSIVSIAITFVSVCWGGNAAKQDRNRQKKTRERVDTVVSIEGKTRSVQLTDVYNSWQTHMSQLRPTRHVMHWDRNVKVDELTKW